MPPVNASPPSYEKPTHDSGPWLVATHYHVGDFHPLPFAGFYRRFRSDPGNTYGTFVIEANETILSAIQLYCSFFPYLIRLGMKKVKFEWDESKNFQNQEKHNVSFEQAQYAFADPNRIIAEDISHSQKEKRYYCFGKVEEEIITVRFTYRANIIRIIGAGYWRKGRKIYDSESKKKN